MPVHNRGMSLGVIGNEVHRYTGLIRRIVVASVAVLKKMAKKGSCASTRRSGYRRSANARRRQCALQARRRVVIKLFVVIDCAMPVEDVGLVPYLPVPGFDLRPPVLLHAVAHPLVNQLLPFVVVARRI